MFNQNFEQPTPRIAEIERRLEALDKRITQLHTIFQELQGDLRRVPDTASIAQNVYERTFKDVDERWKRISKAVDERLGVLEQAVRKSIQSESESPTPQEKSYPIPCAQAAEIVGLTHNQLYNVAYIGDVPCIKNSSGRYMFNREDIEPLRIWVSHLNSMEKSSPAMRHIRLMRQRVVPIEKNQEIK